MALIRLYEKFLAAMPESEAKGLVAFGPQIAQTTTLGDFHRCSRCAEWAIDLIARSDQSHPSPPPSGHHGMARWHRHPSSGSNYL